MFWRKILPLSSGEHLKLPDYIVTYPEDHILIYSVLVHFGKNPFLCEKIAQNVNFLIID
jgi:hypothetical protein